MGLEWRRAWRYTCSFAASSLADALASCSLKSAVEADLTCGAIPKDTAAAAPPKLPEQNRLCMKASATSHAHTS